MSGSTRLEVNRSAPVEVEPAKHSGVPYPSSWIDRLIEWIDGLPGPVWLFYALSILVTAILINVALWLVGSLPVGSIDPLNTFFSVLMFYWIGLYHHLTRVGSRSLRKFSLLLDAEDAEMAAIEYELATLPSWLGWLAIPLGLGLAAVDVMGDPTPYGDIVVQSSMIMVFDLGITGMLGATFFCVIIRSIRQLRMVGKLHARADRLNLLELSPAHAFSDLTARTGIGLILLLVLAYLLDPTSAGTPIDALLYVGIVVLAVAIFVLPIIGMRRLLEDEKDRVLKETSDLLKDTWDSLDRRIKNGEFEDLQGMESAIVSLTNKRELLSKISTWPWNPRTIRGFASTLLLPIFLWLVTRVLERFL